MLAATPAMHKSTQQSHRRRTRRAGPYAVLLKFPGQEVASSSGAQQPRTSTLTARRGPTKPPYNSTMGDDEPTWQPRRSDVTLQSYPHVDKDDRSDPVAWANAREQVMREQMIAKERVKLLRQQVIACYRKEGVNHYVNCKHLTTKYLAIINDRTYGMLKPPGAGAAAEDDDE